MLAIHFPQICLLRGDRLAHQRRPGLAKPENGASRYEYRLSILLLQFHELGESAASPGGGKQAARSFEQSVAIYDDFLGRLDAVNIVSPARVDLWLRFWGLCAAREMVFHCLLD